MRTDGALRSSSAQKDVPLSRACASSSCYRSIRVPCLGAVRDPIDVAQHWLKGGFSPPLSTGGRKGQISQGSSQSWLASFCEDQRSRAILTDAFRGIRGQAGTVGFEEGGTIGMDLVALIQAARHLFQKPPLDPSLERPLHPCLRIVRTVEWCGLVRVSLSTGLWQSDRQEARAPSRLSMWETPRAPFRSHSNGVLVER
jgi:hypothetical protein